MCALSAKGRVSGAPCPSRIIGPASKATMMVDAMKLNMIVVMTM